MACLPWCVLHFCQSAVFTGIHEVVQSAKSTLRGQVRRTQAAACTERKQRNVTKPNPGRRTMDIPELARVLGIGTRQAYEAARRDALPVPTIRLGKRMVVSKDAVERLLGAAVEVAS